MELEEQNMSWHEAVFTDEVQECVQCDYSVTAGAHIVFFENTDRVGHTPAMVRQIYHLVFAGGCYHHEKNVRQRAMWCFPHGAWSLLSVQEISELPSSLMNYGQERAASVFEPLAGYCIKSHGGFEIKPTIGPLPLAVKLVEYRINKLGEETKEERKITIEYRAIPIVLKPATLRQKEE